MSRVFISYSHGGNGPKWKEKLTEALAVFGRHHLLDVWNDERIRASQSWDTEIKQAMGNARAVILLLTPEALESKYILEAELPFIRERWQQEKLPIFPVVCEP